MAITKSKLAFEPKLFIRVALTKGSLLKGQLSNLFMLNNSQYQLSWLPHYQITEHFYHAYKKQTRSVFLCLIKLKYVMLGDSIVSQGNKQYGNWVQMSLAY